MPGVAFAANINYVCSDFTLAGGPSCSGNSIVFTVGGSNERGFDDTPHFTINDNTTYYIVGSVSGSVGSVAIGAQDFGNGARADQDAVAGGGDFHFSITTSGGTNNWFTALKAEPYSGTSATDGSVDSLCFSDVSYADCGYNPPSPDASTTVATTTTINNPNQDVFNGVLLFFIGFFGIIWLFKKR